MTTDYQSMIEGGIDEILNELKVQKSCYNMVDKILCKDMISKGLSHIRNRFSLYPFFINVTYAEMYNLIELIELDDTNRIRKRVQELLKCV